MNSSRRTFLLGVGGAALGNALRSGTPVFAMDKGEPARKWMPEALDPLVCSNTAYNTFWRKEHSCGYAVFYGIVGVMGKQHGEPYSSFPFELFDVFKGGFANWGTRCGALGAAAAAFSLFWEESAHQAMTDELFRWYEAAPLPVYVPREQDTAREVIATKAAGSVFCHISVSSWCYANRIEATDRRRLERCARLCADVCGYAANMINDKLKDGDAWRGRHQVQAAVRNCGGCHEAGGHRENWATGRLDCAPCHSGAGRNWNDKFTDHPEDEGV